MRILILGLNFQPESTGFGKYTSEMAAYLSEAGHRVRVITAPPYFPRLARLEHTTGLSVVEIPARNLVWGTGLSLPAMGATQAFWI